jgi:hypothetical protein
MTSISLKSKVGTIYPNQVKSPNNNVHNLFLFKASKSKILNNSKDDIQKQENSKEML